jgi:hypothetical protein
MPSVAALSALGSGSVGGFQGDLVAHALQLADQAVAVGLAGVALQEPIGPEIRVRLPGRQQVPEITRIECATATIAFLCPRRPFSLAYWLAR